MTKVWLANLVKRGYRGAAVVTIISVVVQAVTSFFIRLSVWRAGRLGRLRLWLTGLLGLLCTWRAWRLGWSFRRDHISSWCWLSLFAWSWLCWSGWSLRFWGWLFRSGWSIRSRVCLWGSGWSLRSRGWLRGCGFSLRFWGWLWGSGWSLRSRGCCLSIDLVWRYRLYYFRRISWFTLLWHCLILFRLGDGCRIHNLSRTYFITRFVLCYWLAVALALSWWLNFGLIFALHLRLWWHKYGVLAAV